MLTQLLSVIKKHKVVIQEEVVEEFLKFPLGPLISMFIHRKELCLQIRQLGK